MQLLNSRSVTVPVFPGSCEDVCGPNGVHPPTCLPLQTFPWLDEWRGHHLPPWELTELAFCSHQLSPRALGTQPLASLVFSHFVPVSFCPLGELLQRASLLNFVFLHYPHKTSPSPSSLSEKIETTLPLPPVRQLPRLPLQLSQRRPSPCQLLPTVRSLCFL